VFEFLGLGAGAVAVASLIHGAVLLVRETRLAVANLHERVALARATQRQP
jgi:hypothetical protein